MTSPKQADELLPCPFCGSSDLLKLRDEVHCARCPSKTFSCASVDADVAWNRRSHLQPPGEWQIVSAARERDRILRARPKMTRDDYFDALGLAEQRLDAAIAAAQSSGDAMSKTVCACGRAPEDCHYPTCQYSSSDAPKTAEPPAAQGEEDRWINLLAKWEDENGTLAGITPEEYEHFITQVRDLAVEWSPRQAREALRHPSPVAQGEAVTVSIDDLEKVAKATAAIDFCLFCRKPKSEVARIYRGPMATICNECVSALSASPVAQGEANQQSVYRWAVDTFGEHATSKTERAARLVEESIELAQAVGLPQDIVTKLTARVYSRPVGEVSRELGGVFLTTLAVAECLGLSAAEEGRREFARVLNLPKDHFQRKVAEKEAAGVENIARHPSRPTGSDGHALASSETDTKMLAAWTAERYPGDYPPYFNLTMVRHQGDLVLTVRLPTVYGAPPGAVSRVRFNREMWKEFMKIVASADTVFKACDELDASAL